MEIGERAAVVTGADAEGTGRAGTCRRGAHVVAGDIDPPAGEEQSGDSRKD